MPVKTMDTKEGLEVLVGLRAMAAMPRFLAVLVFRMSDSPELTALVGEILEEKPRGKGDKYDYMGQIAAAVVAGHITGDPRVLGLERDERVQVLVAEMLWREQTKDGE